MSEAQNLARFNTIHDAVTPGVPGVKHDGVIYAHARISRESAEVLATRFRAGVAGKNHEGDLYGILRRTEHNTAVTHQLVAALKSVSGGQAFDEAKLLAGIEKAVKAGVAGGIESIETTVTVTDGK